MPLRTISDYRIHNNTSTRRYSIIDLAGGRGYNLRMFPPNSNYGTNPLGIVNAIPLQAVPPLVPISYPPYTSYQQPISGKELASEPISKDSNEALLLTLTKKMEELAVNLAKDKEKRQKPTNIRPNIWCSNCKG
jgi:hypothetical protein